MLWCIAGLSQTVSLGPMCHTLFPLQPFSVRRHCPDPIELALVRTAFAPQLSDAMAGTDSEIKCRMCLQFFELEDVMIQNKSLVETVGRTPMYVCKDCNNITYKLRSLKQTDPNLVKGLAELPADQKAKVYDEMRGLFMADVKKHLDETLTHKEVTATEESEAQKPQAMAVTDAQKLSMFVDNPEALQNLLNDKESCFKCPKMGIDMVYVPQYSKSIVDVHTRETIHERALYGTRVIKSHPKKADSTSKAGGAKGPKKLPAGLVKKVETLIANSKNNLGMHGGHVLKAKTDEGSTFVTESMVQRAQDAGQSVADAIAELEAIMPTATMDDKEKVQALFDEFNKKVDVMTDYSTKLIGASGVCWCVCRNAVRLERSAWSSMSDLLRAS